MMIRKIFVIPDTKMYGYKVAVIIIIISVICVIIVIRGLLCFFFDDGLALTESYQLVNFFLLVLEIFIGLKITEQF